MSLKIILVVIIIINSSWKGYGAIFGKNKVRYAKSNFFYFTTDHFCIYFPEKNEELGEWASEVAETSYKDLASLLNCQVSFKIPIIIFPSYYSFQETNIIPDLIEQGIGGFAEIFQNRIVLPYMGSWRNLEHTLKHELTHIFTFQIVYGEFLDEILSFGILPSIPLWLMEGLAELFASDMKLDEEAEMYVCNATLENRLIGIERLEDFFVEDIYLAYKESQALLFYITERWGKNKLVAILQAYKRRKPLEKVLGIKEEELEADFFSFLKSRYYPLLANYEDLKEERLLVENVFGASFSPGGELLTYLTYAGIKVINCQTKEILHHPTSWMKGRHYEELYITSPNALSFSYDGSTIAFLAKNKGKNSIFLYDLLYKKTIRLDIPREIDEIVGIEMYTKNKIIITGLKNGRSRLYLYSGTPQDYILSPLTLHYQDSDVSFHKGGERIIFIRSYYGTHTGLVSLDLPSGKEEIILLTTGKLNSPHFVDDNRIIFGATLKNEIPNLYLLDLEKKEIFKVTNYIWGAFSPIVSTEGDSVAFFSYRRGKHVLYMKNLERIREEQLKCSTSPEFILDCGDYREFHISPKKGGIKRSPLYAYSPKFHLDWRSGELFYSSASGLMTSLNLGVSDTLGNHSIIFSSDYAPSLPKKNNFLFSYIYQKPRASLGINLFSINYYQPFPDLESYQLIYKCGLNLPILYPFSKFQRMEGHFVFGEERKYTFLKQQQIEEKKYNLCIVEAAFVHDTSIFSNFGNTKGSKGRIFCNYAIPLSARYFSAFTFGGDLRYYISLTPRNILANRIFLVKSKGRDKETFYLGGVSFLPQVWSSILRGTDWGALKGHSFINISGEWRFPFIDRLNLALPVSLNNIRGVIFTDFAATQENKVYCYGYGLRLSLGVIPIRLDWAYLYDSKKEVWDKSPKFHFSLGYDF